MVLALVNPNMITKLPYRPPFLRDRGLKYKNTFVIRK